MRRGLPLIAAAVLAMAFVVGLGLWLSAAREEQRAETDGKPAVPACNPQNTVGKAILPDCPKPAFPTPKTP
ncbi:hypothetical protein [Methylobacterium planeticum]|uniref:Molecular chaperone-like protein n=1 Tax=Methylobacterium planeticum TaxID=2615211 RepID=A0A6N6MMK4_9HYPH|nr:hypothetical protein [Methylobacterium planeticum]KAB1072600.1 hypothetical protein F6X51_15020 [Methylobacterium planeticum]